MAFLRWIIAALTAKQVCGAVTIECVEHINRIVSCITTQCVEGIQYDAIAKENWYQLKYVRRFEIDSFINKLNH